MLAGVQMALSPLCLAAGPAISFVGPGGGGWIECVCPSRHVSERLFVGCDVGGFYFSADGGRTYEIRNCGLGDPMVATIAEHPVDPKVLIVGGNGGLYRSFDEGRHWQHLTNGLPRSSNVGHALPIKRVVWDETNPQRIYAATGCPRSDAVNGRFGHVYRSDDAGDTWRMVVASGDPLIARPPVEIFDLTVNATNGNELLSVTSRGLFRSLDAAEHWERVGNGLPSNSVVRTLARSPQNPQRVYATVRDVKTAPSPKKASVWKSDNGGVTWKETTSLPNCVAQCDGTSPMDFWGRMCIVVDPRDQDVVLCGGLWYCPGLSRSCDGGRTWEMVLSDTPAGWVDAFCWQAPCSMGFSRREGGIVAFGTSAGVFISKNHGMSWDQRYTLHASSDDRRVVGTGLNTLCVSDVKPDLFVKDRILVCFYDVGLMETRDAGRSWTRLMTGISDDYSGTCFTVAQSPTESNKLWGVFGAWGGRTKGVFASSEDGGNTWNMRTDASGWVDARADSLCILSESAPYEFAVKHQRQGLLLSRDGGSSWSVVSTDNLPDVGRISSLNFAEGVLYAGTRAQNGCSPRVWRSTDRGRSWSICFEEPGEADGEVSSVAVCGCRVAVTVKCCGEKGGCWLSTDRCATWRRVYSEKPWNDLNDVTFLASGRVAIASRNARWHDDIGGGGIVMSSDEGASWGRVSEEVIGRPEVMVLASDPHVPDRLWAGTWGNSLIAFVPETTKDKNNKRKEN